MTVTESPAGCGALIARHVFGPGVDEPVVSYVGAGTDRRFLASDERGTIVLSTVNAGTAWQVNHYDEFGKPGAWNSGRFQYTGQVWLGEIGVQYSKARMYAPHLGRFLQPDPIGYLGGPNLYAYVLNDPVNLTDPLGLQAPPIGSGPDLIVTGMRPSCPTGAICLPGNPFSATVEAILTVFRHARTTEHRYGGQPELICDATKTKCDIKKTDSEVCVVPGHISGAPIQSGHQYIAYLSVTSSIAGGLVRTRETGLYSFRNTSTLHVFAGTVDRIFTQSPNGSIFVTTIGRGNSPVPGFDAINQSMGPAIFQMQNTYCGAHVSG